LWRMLTRVRAPQDGRTPLHVAAHMRDLEVARLLLEAKADITAKDTVSGGAREMEGWGFGRDKVSGKAGSLGGVLEDLPGMDNCFLAPTNHDLQTTLATQRSCFR